jgi:hypothetical protein
VVRRLPAIYALVILVEIVWLTHRYATDPPSSSSMFSIALGWVGLGSMVIMLIYSVARRSRQLRQVARLTAWLHFHIFMGVQGMLFVLFHSMHLFTREAAINLLNPAVINLVAVVIVFSSGLIGRYLYSLLPRTMTGEQMAAKDVEDELAKMDRPLPREVEALWRDAPPADPTVGGLIRADLRTRASLRALDAMSLDTGVRELAERRVRLARRLAALSAAERLFRKWIILHRPLASIMYVLSAMHVALSYMYTPSLGE